MKTYFRKPRDDRLHQPADKKASRVPAYQNGRKSAGTAILCVKSLTWNPVILQSKQYRR